MHKESLWMCVCVLPLCSGDGVSRGSSDRKTPTSSSALVTTGSLALRSLLKPCEDTHKRAHTSALIVRFFVKQWHDVTVQYGICFHGSYSVLPRSCVVISLRVFHQISENLWSKIMCYSNILLQTWQQKISVVLFVIIFVSCLLFT